MVLTDSNLSEEGLSALPICPGLLQSIAINAKQVGNAAIGHYYLKLTKQQIDASGTVLDEDLGLVRLESHNTTFLEGHAAIQEQRDPKSLPKNKWKFISIPLGLGAKGRN